MGSHNPRTIVNGYWTTREAHISNKLAGPILVGNTQQCLAYTAMLAERAGKYHDGESDGYSWIL